MRGKTAGGDDQIQLVSDLYGNLSSRNGLRMVLSSRSHKDPRLWVGRVMQGLVQVWVSDRLAGKHTRQGQVTGHCRVPRPLQGRLSETATSDKRLGCMQGRQYCDAADDALCGSCGAGPLQEACSSTGTLTIVVEPKLVVGMAVHGSGL